ncbi:MAG TPA: hypothetical protein VMG10_26820 [Gemmataceae bacterium]|nr:hypothetical protein [Gemmataceae bacterium]
MSSFLCCLLADLPSQLLPGRPLLDNNLVFYCVGGGVLLVLVLLILWVRRFRLPAVDPEGGLIENLGDYPPAGPGPQRLFVHGRPVRLRLVVLAPLGKRPLPTDGAVEPLLDQIVRGLGDIARQDRPRIRVWPPQLSHQGFPPTFFRLTRRPEQAGKPSPWVLAAGPVRAGGHQLLVGLALCADGSTDLDNLPLQANQWNEVLRIGPRT